jgi:hypothetical protein
MGDYLPEDEVYVRRMEAYLREGLPGRRIVVVNGGVGGFNLDEEVDLLEDQGLGLAPDLVVVGFYLNDSRPRWGFPGEDGRGWLRRHSVFVDVLSRTLRIQEWMSRKGEGKFRWVRAQRTLDWANDPKAFRQLADMAVFDWGAAWERASWRAIDAGLARLRALSQASRFDVAIAAFPVSFQVYARFLEDAPQRQIEARARAMGFHFLDLLPVLRQHQGEDLFFDHCHPREGANDLAGRALAGFLQAEVLPTAPS